MKVKTYKHQSLQEGLENVKRDLGGDALILSTRPVSVRPRFGLFRKQAWEITAGVEEKHTADLPSPAAGQRAGAAVTATAAPVPSRDPRMDKLIDEITELKKSFRTLSKVIPRPETASGLFTEMVSQGIDETLADNLINNASQGNPTPVEMRERIRGMLADQVIVAPAAELYAKSRVVAVFVGSTGVGKTSTIAKIAGHAAVRMKKKVALVSTDMFRIGGQEQLVRYGELLGIPVYGCADVAALRHLVANLEDCDLILIDTPGSSPADLARLAKLEDVASAADAKVHLVVSATTRSEDLAKIIIRFQRFRPNSVIVTKIDETDSKGALAADLLRNEIPVSYVTNGQRVPEDLLTPGAEEFARYVLPLESAI